jgi:hypothetical protein
MRAKARAIFGPAIAEPMPKQPNGAKALQQRANARPIPTYKVGGVVKKPMPTPADLAAAKAQNEMIKKATVSKKEAATIAAGNRASGLEGAEMRKMKMAKGGKAGKYANGGAPAAQPMGQVTADFGAGLRNQINTGKMTTAQAQATQNNFVRDQMAMRTAADAKATAAQPMGQVTAAYGANLRDQIKAGKMTVAQAQAAQNAFVKQQMAARAQPIKRAKGGKVQTSSDTARKLASEMGGMKKGGKVKQVDVDMKMLEEASRPRASLPNLESKVAEARNLNTVRAKETSDATKKQSFKEAFAEARRDQGANGVFTWRGNTYNTKMAGETSKAAPTRAAAPAAAPASRPAAPAAAAPASRPAATPPAAPTNKSGNASTSMSSVIRNLDSGFDLDALAKKKMAESKDSFFSSPMNIEQAREAVRAEAEMQRRRSANRAQVEKSKASLAAGRKANPDLVSRFVDMTMNPGYKKGGKVKEPKPKNGLAVMIAIGKPMKPAKKMNGGPMAERSTDMESSKVTREMAMGGAPMGYAAGGAGKTRKGQAPIKKAQGGAAKVRKGMMSPEGDIINVMNKMRGK